MKTVHVIGVGLGYSDLTQKHHDIIARADVLVGGKRHLSWFRKHPARKREITAPVDAVIDDIKTWMTDRQVMVLASGDPMFHGIGETIADRLGPERVRVHPNVSVMAEAFARIGRTWKDAAVVSLHGRGQNTERLVSAIDRGGPVFVFTDPANTPETVARIALERNPAGMRICVAERLGEPEERIRWLERAEDAAGSMEPNAVILLPETCGASGAAPPGNPDEAFVHDKGMITRRDVRAISISRLGLTAGSVLWDLGAGSGSVGIEAAALLTNGRVAAVEKHPERVAAIRENIRRFGTDNVTVHHLHLPEGMDTLPDPDRIFAGGGGKDLPEILGKAARRLKPGGRIVVNAVVIETLAAARAALEQAGLSCGVLSVQVNKGKPMPAGIRFCAENPVFVLYATKPGESLDTDRSGEADEHSPVRFVGAGPGDPDLITVKGQKALREADLVVYAGSLVPEAVLAWANPAAECKSSAGLHLEAITDLMARAHGEGKRVVRLHSGDPSLYGAIAEQMNRLEEKGVPFSVVPGVTSAFAAAGALMLEYTVPEKTQTLILTRAAGRTPVPESENLKSLAAHGAAMAVYLSAGLADRVEKDLCQGYGPEAPVAIVHRASRPDQQIFRTTAGNLSKTLSENDIRSTALIIAGPALAENRGIENASKLYDRSFSHGCRKADQ